MDTVTHIIRNVILLLLLFSCLELLIPKGSTGRFVRLAFGLILLSLLIVPVMQTLSLIGEERLTPELLPYPQEDLTAKTEETEQLLFSAALQDYRQSCAADLEELALRLPQISRIQAQVETDGSGAVTAICLQAVGNTGFSSAETEAALEALLREYCPEEAETEITVREDAVP